MFKIVVALAVLLVVKVLASPLYTRSASSYEDKQSIRQEQPCALQGGMCHERDACNPSDIVRLADLCPQQSTFGVVCCYYGASVEVINVFTSMVEH